MLDLSIILIGDGLLPLRCADLLLEKGFDVVGVISTTEELRCWADERGIARIDGGDDIEAFLRRQPFDLMFSVVNSRVLGSAALSRPRLAAVNFHNSLLPRFAGTNASSWAILEGEDIHGVTWHLMTSRVDAGDILSQASLPLEPKETAQTLNLKCYELGLATFEALLTDLPGLLQRAAKQDLARRTFYAAARKPPNAGIISWRSSAEEIDRLVRALTISPDVNSLASPLAALGDTYFVVSRLDVMAERSLRQPGTIVDCSAHGLQVSTATQDVSMRALRSLDGAEVDIPELVRSLGLTRGSLLPESESGVVETIAQEFRRIAPYEAFWTSRLGTIAPLRLPPAGPPSGKRGDSCSSYPLQNLSRIDSALELTNELPSALSLLLVFLGRVTGAWSFDVGFSDKGSGEPRPWRERFFAPYLPFRIDFQPLWTVGQAEDHVRDRLQELAEVETFARDLGARYSKLRRMAESAWQMPIVVTVEAEDARTAWTPGTQLVIDLSLQRKQITWWFDPRTLPTDLVRGLARGHAAFLHHARTSPGVLLGHLQLVDQAERHHLLVALNSKRPGPPHLPEVEPAPFPRDACLHELFEAQVEQNPDAPAVVLHHGDHSLTYRELNEPANQLAHALRQLGVGPNIPVAVILDRSVELIVAIVAILKAGGAYVPLDASWPKQRLLMLLDDTNPPVVLTTQLLAANLSLGDRNILCVDGASALVNGQPSTNAEQRNVATDLASIMFTSGSTGRPKGVKVPHRAIVRLVVGSDFVPWAEKLTFLHLAPVTFDASFFEILGPLVHGGTCVVYDGRLPDLQEMGHALERHHVTCLWLTASLFNLVIDQQPEILKGVRYLVTGGEALSARHVRLALVKLPQTRLVNGYGPTEGVTFSCCFPIPESLPADLSSVPIGRPLANTRVYVLDEQQQPLPMGVPGELFIGGDGLALGYWKQPELTAERFLPDPFAADPNARMYRSGDRCRWLPDGNLEFLGRLDDQVKLRGFRIEPGEIETVLSRHSAVRQCAVVVHGQEGEKHLAAYVVAQAEPPSPHDLRRYLAEHLPEYMVPSVFVSLDALPLTSAGKVDRASLPAPLPPSLTDFAAPMTSLEADIAGVWKSVLGTAYVGLDDKFCDLGGTSLMLVELHHQLTANLHLDLSIVDLFQHSTVRSLARHIGHGGDLPMTDAATERARRQRRAFAEQRRRSQ